MHDDVADTSATHPERAAPVPAPGPIVDAHQHFWDPAKAEYPWMTDDVAELRRRFAPEDLEPLLTTHGVCGTVVVQTRHALNESRQLLTLAEHTPFLLGVVGWIDLTGDVRTQLAGLEGPLVGIRHLVHDEPDPDWLLRDDVHRGIGLLGEAGLAYDLLVRTPQLPAALTTARRHPEVRFVLDHAAKRPEDDREWREGVEALAQCPNVTCKLSGLFTEHDPYGTAALALQWFGPERCMYGSDWPVSLLATEYGDTFSVAGNDAEVLGRTAIRTYRLELAS